MLGAKLTLAFAVTLLVLVLNAENDGKFTYYSPLDGVHAAPEPCRDMMPYYSYMFRRPEKSTKPKEDKDKLEKDKKTDLLKKLEKMFEKMLRRALRLEEEETTEKPRGVTAMEDLLTSYINFLTNLWNI